MSDQPGRQLVTTRSRRRTAAALLKRPSDQTSYSYGTVTAISPLTVRLDSEATAVVTLAVGVYVPVVSDRVLVLVQGADRLVIASTATLPALDPRYVPSAGGVLLTDTTQPISTATVSDITWSDAEVSDPDNWISGGIATLTVPAGKGMRYIVSYVGHWSASPTGTFAGITCYINGVGRYDTTGQSAFATYDHVLTFVRTLAAGDTLKFVCYQDSGSTRNLDSRLEIAPI